MKILHTVEFYFPISGGAQEVVKQLSEHLARMGHDVTVVTTKCKNRDFNSFNGVKIIEFDISGNYVNGYKGASKAYVDFLKKSDYDIILNYAAQQWTTDLMLPILDDIPGKKIFVPCGFSALHKGRYADYYEKMKVWIKKYDICVYLSSSYQDYEFSLNAGATNSVIIPNGADEAEFLVSAGGIRKILTIPEDSLLLLHVGSHTRFKGHKEALAIYRRSHLPNSTFLLIGNTFSKYCNNRCRLTAFCLNTFYNIFNIGKRIIITELPREQTVMAYFDADIFLFPSNIECSPIVLFEAMASGTPFLATDVGNSKEIVQYSHAGLLLPTKKFKNGYVIANVKQSVPILENIVSSVELRDNMASYGRELWQKNFTWLAISKKYEEIYTQVLQ